MATTVGTVFRRLEAQRDQETVAASKTLTASDSFTDQNVATDALTITLPLISASTLGMEFTFRNTGADGANIITLAPNAADAFHGTVVNAAADAVAGGVVDKDFILTKATANKGDFLTIRAVALTEWYIMDGVGIWASEG